uniref:DUF659 domain-containing protein n=1 Tax=Saccharum hybrid cultivar R570 TaxID=131158 RepID=A0A059Q2W7_9POAL|nr:Protein of unknown function DUF659 [Saccharum hybrid cultivar R570]
MATTKANANAVYWNASSSRQGGRTSRASGPQNVCVTNMQADLSSSSSGHGTKSCSLSVDHSLSHKPESERSMGATDNLDSLVANSIGRLVSEAGLEPDFVHLPSFNGVIDLLTRGVRIKMPSYEYILQVQLSEVQKREKAMRQHWERRGCSLILDSWKSQCGRSFISAFVHCREGMLFLRSIDISTVFDDVDELAAMVCCLIDDIGVHDIVQVITNNVSPHMQATEHAVLKKHDQSFIFTVCADHCINLLLENIAELDHVKDVLTKAREITMFLYGHALPMELMKKFFYFDSEIISNSNLKSVAKFLTLETLVSQRENLMEMFSSPNWVSSDLACTSLSMHICEVVQTDSAFWSAADNVLKVTGPLISVLYKLENDNCPVSVLYDAMDSAKETEQMDLYQRRSGLFDSDSAIQEATGTPQEVWWERHGSGTKELQSFAARILGQTCFGAARYNLDKSLSERLHTGKRSFADQERFRNMEYIYYNLRLMNAVPRLDGPPAAQHGKVTAQLSDWVSA